MFLYDDYVVLFLQSSYFSDHIGLFFCVLIVHFLRHKDTPKVLKLAPNAFVFLLGGDVWC